MRKRLIAGLATGIVLVCTVGAANSTTIVYNDKGSFLSDTGAISATGVLPYIGYAGTSVTLGSVTLSSPLGIYVGYSEYDWTTRLSGNDIAVNGYENLAVSINLASDVYSFGFDFVEPENDPHVNAPFVDSTFNVILMNNANVVDSFTFNAPNDLAYFVGAWTDAAFNNIAIQEISGGIENEFFGEFYTGDSPAPVPEPATLLLFGTGLVGLAGSRMRRKKV